jgi:hypothetical protein
VVDIKVTPKNNKAYTMSDIGVIESRVKNLEDYVTLTALEQDTVNYDIIDAGTGLSRYKSGFLIDSFKNADQIADNFNIDFRVAYSSGEIIPSFEMVEADLIITANTASLVGTTLSLPYTEVVFAQQPLSSRITNVNPFSVFSWQGNMTLVPTSDTWTDVTNLPTLLTTSTEVSTNVEWIDASWLRWSGPGWNFTYLAGWNAPSRVVGNQEQIEITQPTPWTAGQLDAYNAGLQGSGS